MRKPFAWVVALAALVVPSAAVAGRQASHSVTFAKDVAPILYEGCVSAIVRRCSRRCRW